MGLDMILERGNKQEVAYWRKANQIRRWFVDKGVIQEDDNCIRRVVDKETLELLVSDCKAVLADHKKAPELIPYAENGFFFGTYLQDDPAYKSECYYADLRDTVEMVERVIAETNWEKEVILYSDWW